MYVGGVILILSLFIPTQWIPSKQLILLSAGTFLIGIGEWKNRKYHSWIKPPNAYSGPAMFMQTKLRANTIFGTLIEIIGLILIIYALYSI